MVGPYFAIIDNSDDLKVVLHLTVVLGKPSLWLVMICASITVMWTNCFPTSLGLPFVGSPDATAGSSKTSNNTIRDLTTISN